MEKDYSNILKDIQKGETQILKEFIRVCEILNLRYFIDNGSLLGTIRHDGFIPWDDDIDVCMPRPDYEEFLKKGQEYLGDRYFVQTNETDEEYANTFAKIRDSETTFIESSVKNRKINHGLYIDIFPYDGYNERRKLRNYIDKKNEMLLNVQINKIYTIDYNKQKGIKRALTNFISDVFYKKCTLKQMLDIKRKIHTRYDFNEYTYIKCYSYFTSRKIIYTKDIFDDLIDHKFEDIYVKVPKDYDSYLRVMYGDYMKLPPKEEQEPHHYTEVVDLNKSYMEYIK